MPNYKFDIDFSRIVAWLIPQEKPRPNLLALALALCSGVRRLYGVVFRDYTTATDYHLSVTPQVWSLEKLLNDRYDRTARRIYIEDGVRYAQVYIYTTPENKPLYIYPQSENKPVYLSLYSESGVVSVTFRVRVPVGILASNKAAIQALVQSYKLASKSFEIIAI